MRERPKRGGLGRGDEDRGCHRARLLEYFGETIPRGFHCGNCSACDGGTEDVGRAAAEDEARRILATRRAELEETGGLDKTGFARFLGGSSSKRIPRAWRELPEFGALSGIPTKNLKRMALTVLEEHLPPESAGPSNVTDPNPDPVDSIPEDVFWRSSRRAFTRDELETRSVPRARGVWILDLVGSSPSGYPPSRITSILRGESRFPSRRQSELSELPHWGLLKDIDYGEILQDVLAMWAKGYLQPCSRSSKRLELSGQGREVLESRRAGEGSGVPPAN